MAGSVSKTPVAREQRRIEYFCERDIDGIISGEIVSQIPYLLQEEGVWIPVQGEIGRVDKSLPPPLRVDISVGCTPANRLRDLDIEQMGSEER